LKPIEVLGANDEKVNLYIDVKPFEYRKSIMFIPIKELVDILSIGVALQIASHYKIQLTEVNSPGDDLHGTKAFVANLEGDVEDYYKTNREKRKTEEEYVLAKQKLVSAVSLLFEAKKQFAKDILSKL
jgi:hypothetical protein